MSLKELFGTSKSHTTKSDSSSTRRDQAAPTSFLFIVNALHTNDNLEDEGCVPPLQDHGRWRPPEVAEGFYAQVPGYIYRWRDGAVSLAQGYHWVAGQIQNDTTVYANGTIQSTTTIEHPLYYSAATVVFCNSWDNFFATRGDAGTRDIKNSTERIDMWNPLHFHHHPRSHASLIDFSAEHTHVAVRRADWIEELLPVPYARQHRGGPDNGGLGGLLPLIIALIAFSCADENELYTVLTQDHSWQGARWRPHGREHGRFSKRGMVVTVFRDPEDPRSTIPALLAMEGRTPIFR